MHGLGNLTNSVTFDPRTLAALRKESGPDEAKVFNLVPGLQAEVESEPRLESVLKDLEARTTTGIAALDMLETLAKEKETVVAAARDSALPPRAFGVYWTLKDDANLEAAKVKAIKFAEEAQALVERFPNAAVNADEQRRLRTSLHDITSEATLADGSEVSFDAYAVTVHWEGQPRDVLIDEADTTPLVGMMLLDRHNLNIDVEDGGRVLIQAKT